MVSRKSKYTRLSKKYKRLGKKYTRMGKKYARMGKTKGASKRRKSRKSRKRRSRKRGGSGCSTPLNTSQYGGRMRGGIGYSPFSKVAMPEL